MLKISPMGRTGKMSKTMEGKLTFWSKFVNILIALRVAPVSESQLGKCKMKLCRLFGSFPRLIIVTFLFVGSYKFKLFSFNVSLACILWFFTPTTILLVGASQLTALQSVFANISTVNTTSNDGIALMTASYVALALEFISSFFTPITMGILMKELEKSEKIHHCPHVWILFITVSTQAIGYCASFLPLSVRMMSLLGSTNVIVLYILPTVLHSVVYLFLKFSALSLLGILMTQVAYKCIQPDKATIIDKAKSCINYHNTLVSNAGPLLAYFMAVNSLLVMLNSFMMYLSCSPSSISFFIYFALTDINGILSLIYVCVVCDDEFNAVRALLLPLR